MNGTISIGNAERQLTDATPNWVNEQLGTRHDSGASTCVRVSIRDTDAQVVLATRACGNSGGGGRAPNPKELRILQLWDSHQLDEPAYPRGQLVAFVQELRRL
jgi:hypothetical protein